MILVHWHKLKEQQIQPEGITFVTSAGFSTSTGTDYTLTGLQSGDFVLCQQSADTGVPDLYTGFTNIKTLSNTVDARWSYIFSTGTSLTFTGTESESVVLAAFRSVNATTPLDVASTSNHPSGERTTLTPASITPVTDGCMICACIAIDDSDQTSATTPTGFTTATALFGGDDVTTIVTYKLQTTATTESPSAFSWSADEVAGTETIALRPA